MVLAQANCEFIIDTNIAYVPAPGYQASPSVASDGTNYFVVWEDQRGGSSDIFGARINSAGTIIDTVGILISSAVNYQTNPSVSFDGTNYFIVWQDYRNGSNDIYGARVTPFGEVLDTLGIPISTAPFNQLSPSVAFDGVNYFVVWEDYRNNFYSPDIYGARVTPEGIVLDTAGIPVSTASSGQRFPFVVFGETNYLVVWADRRNGEYDIYGARISTSGTVIDTNGIPISTAPNTQFFPSVDFDGTNYLVVWEDSRSGSYDIYGARISVNGVLIDTSGIPISTARGSQKYAFVDFNGSNYFVVWSDIRNGVDYDIYGCRITPAGDVLEPNGIPLSTASNGQYSPAIAFNGTNYLTVWKDRRNEYFDIYGTRIDQSGSVLEPEGILISIAGYGQYFPSAAFDGTNYLIVWEDRRNNSEYDIYGMRISSSGTPIDPVAIPISTALNNQYSPSVAFDGTNYLVVWEDSRNGSYRDIYGARISRSGTILDIDGIPISTAPDVQSCPSVVFDGTNYFIVWQDRRNGVFDIYGARVNPSGELLDTNGIPLSTLQNNQYSPSVAFDGTNYFVVWYQDVGNYAIDIYGIRVDRTGAILDTVEIPISTATDNQYFPSVAFDGVNYFVVWEDYRNSSFPDIYGTRVTTSGIVLDSNGIPISTATGRQYSSSITFNGQNYLIVWEDWRTGYGDIYGACVTTSGDILDTFPLSTGFGNQLSPFITHGSENQTLIVYSGGTNYINNHPVNTMRIWGRFFEGVKIKEFSYKNIGEFPFLTCFIIKEKAILQFYLSKKMYGSLKIYDVGGRIVGNLFSGNLTPGNHKFIFRPKRKGVYFYKLNLNNFIKKGKIVIF